jgi:NO-binding membrane sensor protein with MHYT domain
MGHSRYDFSSDLVILSFGISFLGAYIAISLCEQLRQSMLDDKRIHGTRTKISHRKNHLLLLFLMSLSISGVGIWSMHFIGMHALMVYDQTGHIMHMTYNVALSVLSFICVLFTTFVGMTTASYDVMFSKDKQEILEQLISDTKNLSMHEIRKIDYKKLLLIISTKRLGRLIFGGVITGSGVSIMHYIGMVAMVFDGRIVWNPFIVFLSVIIAIVASTAAFWIFFRFLSIFPELEYLRILSALIMGIAVCGMHYTGMTAASYELGKASDAVGHEFKKNNMRSDDSYSSALLGANLMLWIIAMYMIWIYRRASQLQASLLQHADQIAQYVMVDSTQQSTTTGTAGMIINHEFQSSADANTTAAPSSASAIHIRHIVEQYMTKRFRPSALLPLGRHKKPGHHHHHSTSPLSPTSGGAPPSDSSMLQQQMQQAHTSFTYFLCFSLYWAVTGHWDFVRYICCVDNFDDRTQSSAVQLSGGDGRLSLEYSDRNHVSSSHTENSRREKISTRICSNFLTLSTSATVAPETTSSDIESARSPKQTQLPSSHETNSSHVVGPVAETEEDMEVLVAISSSKKMNDNSPQAFLLSQQQSFSTTATNLSSVASGKHAASFGSGAIGAHTLPQRKPSVPGGQYVSPAQVLPTPERVEEEDSVTNLYTTSAPSTSENESAMNDENQHGAGHNNNAVNAFGNAANEFDMRSLASSPRLLSRDSSHLSSEIV